MDFSQLSLQDLLNPGEKGRVIRQAVAEGVAAGIVDSALCLQLAEACSHQGQAGSALQLITAAFASDRLDWRQAETLIAGNFLGVVKGLEPAGGGAADIGTLAAFFARLDGMDAVQHAGVMGKLIAELVQDVSTCRQLVAGFGQYPPFAASQSATGALLAAALFSNDIERARHLAGRLEDLSGRLLWTERALTKFALLTGDYAHAETLSRGTIERFGERLYELCDLAVSLFCQGQEKAGREVLARSADLVRDHGNVMERQRQIAEWSRQLEELIAAGAVDGGDFERIGAAIRYTRPDRAEAFYQEHRDSCVEANGFRTVSGYTNNVMFGEVEKLLAAHPSIRKVVNYGTLCGIREYELAARYPDVVWAGYDISELATEWNSEAYRRDNLLFDSDLEGLLTRLEGVPGDGLLVHCRTTDIMLPEAVKRIYRCCRKHGIGRIMTAEYFTRSMTTLEYPDWENNPVDTVHWDGVLVVHNYRKILPETGYRVVKAEFRPVPLLISATGEGLLIDQMIELVHGERADG